MKVGNQLWLYGLVLVGMSGLLITSAFIELSRRLPELANAYRHGAFLRWNMNLPLLFSLFLRLSASSLGGAIGIYCFFFGLRCFVPPAIPERTPKDFRNQSQIPELLALGEIRTLFIPRSPVVTLLRKFIHGFRYMSVEPKRTVIANVRFVFRALISAVIIYAIYLYRSEILFLLDSIGVHASGMEIPSPVPLLILLGAVSVARLAGVIAIIRYHLPETKTLIETGVHEFTGHPNLVYSAIQSASENIRTGDFLNRTYIDEKALIEAKLPATGTFSGTILVETQPLWQRPRLKAGGVLLLLAGTALIILIFRWYLGMDYSIDPILHPDFMKKVFPKYLLEGITFAFGLVWGRGLFLQSLRLFDHYRYRSKMLSAEFSGSYTAGTDGGMDAHSFFRTKVEIVYRATVTESESFRVWGQRELLSFAPQEKTPETLEKIRRGVKQEFSGKV